VAKASLPTSDTNYRAPHLVFITHTDEEEAKRMLDEKRRKEAEVEWCICPRCEKLIRRDGFEGRIGK